MTTHISAAQAAEIDEKLMGPEYGFTLEQLMELAGLSVAPATREVFMSLINISEPTRQRRMGVCRVWF